MKHIRRIPSSADYSLTSAPLSRREAVVPRVVGFDDGPSTTRAVVKSHISLAALIGVWFHGFRVCAVRIGLLTVDGLDVTNMLLKLLRCEPADIIFLSGASFAGFNVIDSRKLYRAIGIPTIIVSRDMPDNASVKRALKKHFVDWRTRWKFVRELGRIHEFVPIPLGGPLYFETIGLPARLARKIIRGYCVSSRIPEPIRVAGLLARDFAPAGNELCCAQREVGYAQR